jgi:biotin carboxylase
MTTLLIIGAGRLQMPAYIVGRRLGLHLVGVDRNSQAPGLAMADASYPIDTRDVEGIMTVARRHAVDGVVTLCTDQPVRVVSAVAAQLGLRAISPEAAALATNKAAMRDAFARAGAPSPKHRRVRNKAALSEAIADLGLPVIVKPPAASGSRGICTIRVKEEARAALAHALRYADGEVVVEEFVEGPEVSIETLSFGGQHYVVAITDKRTTGEPHWVELGHVEPSRLTEALQRDVAEAAVAGLRALGIDDAAGHVEVKASSNGPKLIEIGARLGGDFIGAELALRSTGVDMVEALIYIALGQRPNVTRTRSAAAAIQYLAAVPGRVTHVEGLEEARKMEGVVRLEVDVRLGDNVGAVHSSLDRPGFVICEGATPGEAEARAHRAALGIRIGTEPS